MVNIYDSIRSDDGSLIKERRKIFIKSTHEDGSIDECTSGISFSPQVGGTMFIVDDYAIEQIEKLKFIDGVLSVKDEEELIPPVKTEKELKREALLRQIAELDAAEDEPVDIEDQPSE